MKSRLSAAELQVVKRYLGTGRSGRQLRPRWATLIAAAVAITGLVLAIYAVILFLHNPTDRVATFVLLPGAGGGFFLILASIWIFKYQERSVERARLASVLRKLLADDMSLHGR